MFHSKVDEDAKLEMEAIISNYSALFSSEVGQKVLADLKKRFVDKQMAMVGDDLLNVGLRQGQANTVMFIMAQIEKAKEL